MILKRVLLVFFAAILTLSACRKDEEEVALESSKKVWLSTIIGVNGPTSGAVDQELTFDLLWHSADSTQRFHHLLDSADNNTRIIKLYTKALHPDSLQLDTGVAPVRYKFKAPVAGTYFLKFYSDSTEKSAIIDTVTIQ